MQAKSVSVVARRFWWAGIRLINHQPCSAPQHQQRPMDMSGVLIAEQAGRCITAPRNPKQITPLTRDPALKSDRVFCLAQQLKEIIEFHSSQTSSLKI